MSYILPISGLKLGVHTFKFQPRSRFFKAFPQSPIHGGSVKVILDFDKRRDMMVLDFRFKGEVVTICDRCAEDLKLEIKGKSQLIVKATDEHLEDEAEVMYIPSEQPNFDVSDILQELFVLRLPFRRVCPDDETGKSTCNPVVLKYLTEDKGVSENEIQSNIGSSVWDALKTNIEKNKN